jgi:predicted nuclease of restriction endonuclease-like (RecB) superfamily
VETLSKDLQNEFVGVQGYAVRNLWYMRNFYEQYKDNTKLQPLVAEISWSHNLVIMEKCKDDLEREFYIPCSRKQFLLPPRCIGMVRLPGSRCARQQIGRLPVKASKP